MTPHRNRRSAGFSLLEMAITVVILLSLLAYGIPKFQTVIYNYQLDGAVDACTYAIQANRYRAVQMGYPYQISINATNNTYQVLNDTTYPTTPITYANVGSAQPVSSAAVTISSSVTYTFSPSGLVTVTSGSNPFTVSYQGHTKTITVSSYGQVHVQ